MFDFQKQVIERSYTIPVLVDFWASWCGPCKILGPVLEQAAREQEGRWELVKVSTEEHPELAQQYQVRSIPNVKLFHNGKVVNEFAGALSKFRLEQWLAENIPDPQAAGLESILNEGGPDLEERLRSFIKSNPGNKEAQMALARLVVFNNPGEALELTGDIKEGDPHYDDAEDVRALVQLMQFQPDNNSKAAAALFTAKEALQNNQPETAIQQIIEATLADKNLADDLPRRAAIALFHNWGPDHELTRQYRRRFDMALY